MEWLPENRPCPICESTDRRAVGRRGGEAHRSRAGVLGQVVCCLRCTALYTNPTLLPRGNPYAAADPATYFCRHQQDLKRKSGRMLAKTAEALLGRKGSVLEVGCGRGDLLEGMRDEGWDVRGIEMTPAFAAIAEAKSVPVERRPVEAAESLVGDYDFVILAAVLEHLYRPTTVLRRVRSALRRGGLVFIDVPNEGSLTMTAGNLYMRATGRDWCINLSPTFPPFHVVGFTPKALRYALDASSFTVHRLATPRWRNDLPEPRTFRDHLESWGLTLASWAGSVVGVGDGITCWGTAV